jgi:hypothetical protein
MLKLESGVPIPQRPNTAIGSLNETMRAMNVGDSFALGGMSAGNIYTVARCLGITVTMRTDKAKREVRVWRIS